MHRVNGMELAQKLNSKSIGKNFGKYVSLNVLSMLGLSVYILADTFFIASKVGNNGLTALNIVIPFFSLLHGFGLLLGVGGSTMFSTAKGEGNEQKSQRIFTQVFIMAVVLGAICMFLGTVLPRQISYMLGADADTIDLCVKYLRTVSYFSIPFVLNGMVVCFVRNDGAPMLAMLAMLASSFGNIILDYILMFPFDLGIFGASFATGLSPTLSLIILSFHLFSKKSSIKLNKPTFKTQDVKFVLTTGLPSFVTEMSNGIVIMLFNLVIYKLSGNVGISAYSVVANLSLVAVNCLNGIGQGLQPLASFSYGAKNKNNLKKTLLYGVISAACLGVMFYLIFHFNRYWLIKIFNKDSVEQMTVLGQKAVTLYCIAFFFTGFNLVCGAFFASTNKQTNSFIICLSRGLVLPIILLYINSATIGIVGVWLAVPIAEFITMLIGILMLILSNKRFFKKRTSLNNFDNGRTEESITSQSDSIAEESSDNV